MLNKKGTSIIELIVSIALLAVILTFMLKLLVDLNNVRTNTSFAKENQIIRSEIIRTIENDIKNKKIKEIKSIDDHDNRNHMKLEFVFVEGSSSSIEFTSNTLTYVYYQGTNKKQRKWTMDSCTLYTEKVFVNNITATASRSYGFVLNIQVHTSNKENSRNHNNPLDDIQISYFGTDNNSYTFNDSYT